MPTQFEFAVEPLAAGQWVIAASDDTRDSVLVIGVYTSEWAAKAALPAAAANFLEVRNVRHLHPIETRIAFDQVLKKLIWNLDMLAILGHHRRVRRRFVDKTRRCSQPK